MVKYSRNLTPLCLVDEKVEKLFNENNLEEKYIDKNSSYKCKKQENNIKLNIIRDILKEIYKNKCAYCETQLNRTFINIEHYRPKSIYYWLAYSWSNLLPICDECNTKKSNKFDIKSKRASYSEESIKDLQYITREYNEDENPLFIHPEIDNYEDMFRFNHKGEIVVYKKVIDSDKMSYTIKHSDLNEKALINRREKVLRDFIRLKILLFDLYSLAIEHKDKEKLNKFKESIREEIKFFFDDSNEFIAVRKFIIKKINLFLLSLDKRFIEIFKKYLQQYIKNMEVYQ